MGLTAEQPAETVASRLQQLLQERGWSVYRLHRESGLSERHLGEIVADEVTKPRPSTLARIADALGIPVVALDPSAPRGTEFSVTLTAEEQDVLHAVAAAQRLPIGAVVRQAVLDSVSRWREQPDVQTILGAMKAPGRTPL